MSQDQCACSSAQSWNYRKSSGTETGKQRQESAGYTNVSFRSAPQHATRVDAVRDQSYGQHDKHRQDQPGQDFTRGGVPYQPAEQKVNPAALAAKNHEDR